MGHTFRRRNKETRAAINARIQRIERHKTHHPQQEHRSMQNRVDDAMAQARHDLMSRGGLIAVALGRDIELPKRWRDEPRVFPIDTLNLGYSEIHEAIPSNTRIVILTDAIPNAIFHPIQKEIKRRHINYLVRK